MLFLFLNSIKRARMAGTSENSKLEQENSKLEQENSKLEQENSKLEQENGELKEKVARLEQENRELNEKVAQSKQKLDEHEFMLYVPQMRGIDSCLTEKFGGKESTTNLDLPTLDPECKIKLAIGKLYKLSLIAGKSEGFHYFILAVSDSNSDAYRSFRQWKIKVFPLTHKDMSDALCKFYDENPYWKWDLVPGTLAMTVFGEFYRTGFLS